MKVYNRKKYLSDKLVYELKLITSKDQWVLQENKNDLFLVALNYSDLVDKLLEIENQDLQRELIEIISIYKGDDFESIEEHNIPVKDSGELEDILLELNEEPVEEEINVQEESIYEKFNELKKRVEGE